MILYLFTWSHTGHGSVSCDGQGNTDVSDVQLLILIKQQQQQSCADQGEVEALQTDLPVSLPLKLIARADLMPGFC